MGRRPEVVRELEGEMELNPVSLVARAEAAEMCSWVRDYERAIRYANQALEVDPSFPRAHFVLGRVYDAQGRLPEAITEYEKAGASGETTERRRRAFEREGRAGYYRSELGALERAATEGPASSIYFARLHARLGRPGEAFADLERAYQARDPLLALIKPLEWFDPLRSDPRFVDLIRRIGIPD